MTQTAAAIPTDDRYPTTVGECLRTARAGLPRMDADVLTAHALGCPRSALYAFPERSVPARGARRLSGLVDRRQRGEPIAYILGEREFWSLPLRVDPRVLIPRPETECLVEAALARIGEGAKVLDLGTGSGAVAIAIAASRPKAHVLGADREPGCVHVARENARRLGLTAAFVVSDWCSALRASERFDVIVANPPYVAEGDPHLARGDLRFEPRAALVSGSDGLEALRQVIREAPAHLEAGGWLLVEHGHDQRTPVRSMFAERSLEDIETTRDLAGLPRVTSARRPGARNP